MRHFQRGVTKGKQQHAHWACKLWQDFHSEPTYRNFQVLCFSCLGYICLSWGREGWVHFSKWSQVEWKTDAMVWFPQFVGGTSSPLAGFKNLLCWGHTVAKKDSLAFATSSNRVSKYDGGVLNDIEIDMMESRWKYFEFSKLIQSPREMKPYPQFLANFIFSWDVKMNTLIRKRIMLRNLWNSKFQYFILCEPFKFKPKIPFPLWANVL